MDNPGKKKPPAAGAKKPTRAAKKKTGPEAATSATTATPPLSRQEKDRLAHLEAVCAAGMNDIATARRTVREINRGQLDKVAKVGRAPREIRDKNLYRKKGETFEAYFAAEFKRSRQLAYQMITTSHIVDTLSTAVDKITSEWQLRPLAALQPGQWRAAFDRAVERAGDRPPTRDQVQAVVDEIRGRTPVPKPAPKPEPGPADAARRVKDADKLVEDVVSRHGGSDDPGRLADPYTILGLTKALTKRLRAFTGRAGCPSCEQNALREMLRGLGPEERRVLALLEGGDDDDDHDDTRVGSEADSDARPRPVSGDSFVPRKPATVEVVDAISGSFCTLATAIHGVDADEAAQAVAASPTALKRSKVDQAIKDILPWVRVFHPGIWRQRG
jgi:hypothetical protein